MAGPPAYRVRRADVAEPLLAARHDYADAFAVELERPDAHSPEQWARAALDQASPGVRRTVRFAQVQLLRLHLRPPADPGSVLGWPVVSSTDEVLHLRAAGPLLRGDIVGRRLSPHVVVITTALVFQRRAAGYLWLLVGPVHRRIARLLLGQAAATLTADAPA